MAKPCFCQARWLERAPLRPDLGSADRAPLLRCMNCEIYLLPQYNRGLIVDRYLTADKSNPLEGQEDNWP